MFFGAQLSPLPSEDRDTLSKQSDKETWPNFSSIPGDPSLEEPPFWSQASLGSECKTPSRLSWFQEMLPPSLPASPSPCLPACLPARGDSVTQRSPAPEGLIYGLSLQESYSTKSSSPRAPVLSTQPVSRKAPCWARGGQCGSEKKGSLQGRLEGRGQDARIQWPTETRHLRSKELGSRSLIGKRHFISMNFSPGSQQSRSEGIEVKETPCTAYASLAPQHDC